MYFHYYNWSYWIENNNKGLQHCFVLRCRFGFTTLTPSICWLSDGKRVKTVFMVAYRFVLLSNTVIACLVLAELLPRDKAAGWRTLWWHLKMRRGDATGEKRPKKTPLKNSSIKPHWSATLPLSSTATTANPVKWSVNN